MLGEHMRERAMKRAKAGGERHKGHVVAYLRVSATDQKLDIRVHAKFARSTAMLDLGHHEALRPISRTHPWPPLVVD